MLLALQQNWLSGHLAEELLIMGDWNIQFLSRR
jgi:hypothetical protein